MSDHCLFTELSGEWRRYNIAHLSDAVTWWNSTGRAYGSRSPEVRKWMLDSDNYVIDYYKINRSSGGKLRERYLAPRK
ncbi:hypothetical protein JWG41_18205 [Leptospira sp. 201903075]|nr:hypothetical protein [Leptospira chreensis]